MADNMNDVLQELSALLRRITEQNDVSQRRQEEFRARMDARKDSDDSPFSPRHLREESQRRQEQFKSQMEESRANAKKMAEIVDRRRDEDVQFRERLLQMLEHHNELLESLIARLRNDQKKG